MSDVMDDFRNLDKRLGREIRRWKQDDSGRFLRRCGREYIPMSKQGEKEVTEILKTILDKCDSMLSFYFGTQRSNIISE